MKSDMKVISDRLNDIQGTVEAMEMRLDAAERVAKKVNDVLQKMADMRIEYTDLYTKVQQDMASVRGSIAVQAREGRKLNLPEPMYALLDLEEEQRLKSLGFGDKQIKEYAAMKVKMEQMQTLMSGGSHQGAKSAVDKKEGNDTLKSAAPLPVDNGANSSKHQGGGTSRGPQAARQRGH